MTDPVSIGFTVAGLVAAGALDKVGADALDGIKRLTSRLRSWWSSSNDGAGLGVLELVEAAPDSNSAVEKLAAAVTVAAQSDDHLASELDEMVKQARKNASPELEGIFVQIGDRARVGRVINLVHGDYVENKEAGS